VPGRTRDAPRCVLRAARPCWCCLISRVRPLRQHAMTSGRPPPRRYFFSTLLSLWNRTLLGKSHGIFGMGAFPGATALAFRRTQEPPGALRLTPCGPGARQRPC
jgi:hypothetical protein